MNNIKLTALIGIGCLFAVRLYYEYVPRGVAFTPFIEYSHELPQIISPSGKKYQVFVNDAGAMHSGNHWTWVIHSNWLTGRYVVTEGYIKSKYSTGDSGLIVKWNDDIPTIPFEEGRYD